MTTQEIAHAAAEQIEKTAAIGTSFFNRSVAEEIVAGAIRRALDEQGAADVHHVHEHSQPPGGVDHKLTHSTTGITLETDVTRPRQPGESFEEAAALSAALVAMAYRVALLQLAQEGVQVGPFKKEAKA